VNRAPVLDKESGTGVIVVVISTRAIEFRVRPMFRGRLNMRFGRAGWMCAKLSNAFSTGIVEF
jgi:hypothetical protein